MTVIEMNPRVSRSSALASKATGLPDCQNRGEACGGHDAGRNSQMTSPRRRRLALSRQSITWWSKIPKWQFEKFAGRRYDAGYADEIGRRSNGDRPNV